MLFGYVGALHMYDIVLAYNQVTVMQFPSAAFTIFPINYLAIVKSKRYFFFFLIW